MTFNDILIPARLLILLAHCSIAIVNMHNQDENIKACLPLEYSLEDYELKNTELSIGLGVALGLIGIEIFGFVSGLTMFMPSVAVVSIFCHCTAAISLSYFITDQWDCNLYWWIFGFCSVVPAVIELMVILGFICCKKR